MSDTFGLFIPTAWTAGYSVATVNGVSTAATDIWQGVSQVGRRWLFTVKGADVHILFGDKTVAAATTTNALWIPAGSGFPVFIDESNRYFTVVATTAVVGQAVTWGRWSP